MIKRLYNYWLLPEIPEEAKGYRFFFVVNGSGLWACNDLYESQSAHLIIPGNGCFYTLREDGNAWTLAETYSGMDSTGFNYSYNDSYIWVSQDIPNSQGTIVFQTSDRGFVEYGWTDGGEGDDLSVLQFTVPQGFHIAGKWRCIVSGTDSPVASLEWYINGVLISTETESDCRPTADNIGVFTYECVITFENGKSVTAGPMTMTVEEYDPGGDPDPGGGGGGGGDGDGGDETSLVTGIDLHVYPETVVPGGRATIEVTVNGIGNYSKAFTARLSGHASAETELLPEGSNCTVQIAEDETAEYVLVTVASVQDPTITATEMIYIDYSGTEDEGTTQEQLQRAFWKGYAAARAYFQEAKVSASASIHIAREEAEPTTKAGKLRRSFWQGFVSALIVAAGDTVPEGVLISSDGYILTDRNGIYLIVADASSPDTPVAYLYNGVQLPPLPDWDTEKYPYAHIYPGISAFGPPSYYSLYPSDKPLRYGEVNGELCIYSQAGYSHCIYRCRLTDGEFKVWEYLGEEPAATSDAKQETIWTNHDVISDMDGSVYYAASCPIDAETGEEIPGWEPVPVYEN